MSPAVKADVEAVFLFLPTAVVAGMLACPFLFNSISALYEGQIFGNSCCCDSRYNKVPRQEDLLDPNSLGCKTYVRLFSLSLLYGVKTVDALFVAIG
jgi:hypothetical protein